MIYIIYLFNILVYVDKFIHRSPFLLCFRLENLNYIKWEIILYV